MMNHYVFGAPDSQTSFDGATDDLEFAIDTALAQLDLGFNDDLDTNDLYSAQLPTVVADGMVDPSLADKLIYAPMAAAAAATNPVQELVVDNPLSALTSAETGSTSRVKKGHSKRLGGKTHNFNGMVVARRSSRIQGEK